MTLTHDRYKDNVDIITLAWRITLGFWLDSGCPLSECKVTFTAALFDLFVRHFVKKRGGGVDGLLE